MGVDTPFHLALLFLMIILGIDPGSLKAGYGVIELQGRKMTYIDSGTLKYDSKLDLMDRLGPIHASGIELIEKYSPEEISIESLIYVKSVTSLAKLAQARGAMMAAFMENYQRRVFEYSPNLVKSSVTGHGHANKESIDKAISMMFGKREFTSHDETDALAIAVCHALNRNVQKKTANNTHKAFSGGRSLKQVFSRGFEK